MKRKIYSSSIALTAIAGVAIGISNFNSTEINPMEAANIEALCQGIVDIDKCGDDCSTYYFGEFCCNLFGLTLRHRDNTNYN